MLEVPNRLFLYGRPPCAAAQTALSKLAVGLLQLRFDALLRSGTRRLNMIYIVAGLIATAKTHSPYPSMPNRFASLFAKLVTVSLILSFTLIVLSSLMRLSNQGLGCDDWPACYGRVDIAKYAGDIGATDSRGLQPGALAPPSAVERAHRGVASTLLVFILAVAIVAWRRRKGVGPGMALPLAAFVITLLLAVLGVMYGSPLLRPPIVMANLLGGMVLLGVLWWLWLNQGRREVATEASVVAASLRKWALLGLALVVAQTALGGWVSSNFSALACPALPFCGGAEMDIAAGFTLRQLLEVSPQGRVVMEPAATVGIHVMHRLGALLVLAFLVWLGYRLLKQDGRPRTLGMVLLALLGLQILLGMAVAMLGSPLGMVVSHNATAALLWLTLLALIHDLSSPQTITGYHQ